MDGGRARPKNARAQKVRRTTSLVRPDRCALRAELNEHYERRSPMEPAQLSANRPSTTSFTGLLLWCRARSSVHLHRCQQRARAVILTIFVRGTPGQVAAHLYGYVAVSRYYLCVTC
uniref:Uncharacterized protein n=1 Tax=Plectus sambesii TaxID=2011161 RepID=A0A914V3V5_9BILA